MLNVNLDTTTGIAVIEPVGQLEKEDFINASKLIDPYIEENGKLNGIIIHSKSFPGWDSFGAMIKHMKFVKEHHTNVTHVAFVTDSKLCSAAENIADHFVKAEVKNFSFNEMNEAKAWITNN